MNPEIAEYWEKALKEYDDAEAALDKGESESSVINKLWMALVYGDKMTKSLNPESLISSGTGIALENLKELERRGTKEL